MLYANNILSHSRKLFSKSALLLTYNYVEFGNPKHKNTVIYSYKNVILR